MKYGSQSFEVPALWNLNDVIRFFENGLHRFRFLFSCIFLSLDSSVDENVLAFERWVGFETCHYERKPTYFHAQIKLRSAAMYTAIRLDNL